MLSEEKILKDAETSNGSENIRKGIQSIKLDGANFAEAMMEKGQDGYTQMKLKSTEYIKSLEREVASKPIQSMAIALGVGMILSSLLRRA
jgi:hypothetical protein